MNVLVPLLFVLVAVLTANAAVGWPFARPWLRAVRIDRVESGGGIEMELSDGRVYRSTFNGWIRFPDGTKPSSGLRVWLDDELDRVKAIDRSSQDEAEK